MRRRLHLYVLLVTIGTAGRVALGQSAAIKQVEVSTHEQNVVVEVDLTTPVVPSLSFAEHPDRVIADFPNTTPKELFRRIHVGRNGVARVRIGLNQSNPPVTRVVVDLDVMRPFKIDTLGSKVLLSILPPGEASQAPGLVAAPPAATPNAIKEKPPAPSPTNATGLPNASVTPADAQHPATFHAARRGFRIRGIAADAVYLDGGSNMGLQTGMKLIVCDSDPASDDLKAFCGAVAELAITAVATSSAVAEVYGAKRQLKRGDRAFLTPEDEQAMRIAAATSKLPPVQAQPGGTLLSNAQARRLSAEDAGGLAESQLRLRIGTDYSGLTSTGSTPGTTTQTGLSFQSNTTNMFGTHWNLQGYWRGNINHHLQFQEPTIQETLDKTYTMQLYYDNPDSAWVAGVGRLYLPWAVSLDTIDGGYLGYKLGGGATLVAFAGTVPNISSWHFDPNQRTGGSFVNFSGGDYDAFHYSSTTGFGAETFGWKLDRPFVFAENEVSYKNLFSVYHSLSADSPRGVTTLGIRPGAGIEHSYLTVHFHPIQKLSFDVYHNYFRDVPTESLQLVGLGLADTLVFQGVSAGVHFEPLSHVMLYTTFGRSKDTGDTHHSLNQMYGLTWIEIAHTGIRADFHYSKFDSDFANGIYRLLSISRQITHVTFFNVLLGDQNLISPYTTNDRSKFAATSLDFNLGKHSFIQSGYTFVNGNTLNYREWYSTLGFRLDRKSHAGYPAAIPSSPAGIAGNPAAIPRQ